MLRRARDALRAAKAGGVGARGTLDRVLLMSFKRWVKNCLPGVSSASLCHLEASHALTRRSACGLYPIDMQLCPRWLSPATHPSVLPRSFPSHAGLFKPVPRQGKLHLYTYITLDQTQTAPGSLSNADAFRKLPLCKQSAAASTSWKASALSSFRRCALLSFSA